jgi:hypothetical protein
MSNLESPAPRPSTATFMHLVELARRVAREITRLGDIELTLPQVYTDPRRHHEMETLAAMPEIPVQPDSPTPGLG